MTMPCISTLTLNWFILIWYHLPVLSCYLWPWIVEDMLEEAGDIGGVGVDPAQGDLVVLLS